MIVGVILAAGDGSRFGARKQDMLIAGVSVLNRAVNTAVEMCDRVIVVYHGNLVYPDLWTVVDGGDTRSQSVRSALRFLETDGWDEFDVEHDVVVVHDAARPLASQAVWARVIDAVECGAICAVPTIAVTDSMRRRGGPPVDRDEFWLAQTPQAFRAGTLFDLHANEPECSDDAGLLTLGVQFVPGETSNIKITHPADIELAATLLRRM